MSSHILSGRADLKIPINSSVIAFVKKYSKSYSLYKNLKKIFDY